MTRTCTDCGEPAVGYMWCRGGGSWDLCQEHMWFYQAEYDELPRWYFFRFPEGVNA